MTNEAKLAGASGATYSYEAVTIDHPWKNIAGNYAFALRHDMGHWHVFYVAETSNFQESLPHHALWPEAVSYGCTHVLAHVNEDGVQARRLEEHDLIEGLWPPMNHLHDPLAPVKVGSL